jgi:dipeptidyl aminopeptidase/acylaminoacyl peptidase
MSANDIDLDRRLARWLASEATDGPPSGLLEAILIETASTPRRAAWQMWSLSVPRALRRGRTATLVMRAGLVAAVLLGLVAAAIALSAGGRRLPDPVGPAATGLLVFDDGGDIFVERPGDPVRRALTSGPAVETSPSFSPDGRLIAYWLRSAIGAPSSLWVMNADGSDAHDVTGALDLSGSENIQAAWSPDSRHLAFSAGDYYSSSRLYVAEAAGGGAREIGNDGLSRVDPSWSPDGRLIAFRGGTNGVLPDAFPADEAIGVYVIAPDGSGQLKIGHLPRAGGAPNQFGGPLSGSPPSWSPDGRWLAYAYGPAAQHDIATSAVDGSEERQIVTTADDDMLPVFSPDGTRIAFVRTVAQADDPAGLDSAWTVPAFGGTPLAIDPAGPGIDFQPLVWSPDGRQLLTYGRDGKQIRLVPSDGGPGTVVVIGAPDTAFPNGIYPAWNEERASWQRLAP